jgi:hypothetical protein
MKIRALVKSVAFAAALIVLPGSALGGDWCQVTELYSFSNRVHVKCAQLAYPGFSYFAVPLSSAAEVASFASMASMAMGGYLWIDYNMFDTSATSFGCAANDCRRALSWRLLP